MPPRALTVRLPEDEHNALRLYAFLTKTSLNETVLTAVREFLATKSDELTDMAIDRFRTDYRVALDKLADL